LLLLLPPRSARLQFNSVWTFGREGRKEGRRGISDGTYWDGEERERGRGEPHIEERETINEITGRLCNGKSKAVPNVLMREARPARSGFGHVIFSRKTLFRLCAAGETTAGEKIKRNDIFPAARFSSSSSTA
jgi:hypothetical protein